MEFRVLGPLEAISGARSLPLGGRKQRALLAMLLIHANEVVANDRLIDAVWDESPPDGVANSLQAHVSKLRKSLTEDVGTSSGNVGAPAHLVAASS